MKSKLIYIVATITMIVSCHTKKPFHNVAVKNPEFIPDTAFVSSEDLSSPKFHALKVKYQLDTIFLIQSLNNKILFSSSFSPWKIVSSWYFTFNAWNLGDDKSSEDTKAVSGMNSGFLTATL